jgi:hypothetical protein
MREGWRGVLDAWEELRFEADEYRALDDERILVLYRWSGRGKGSGLEIGQIRTGSEPVLRPRRQGDEDGQLP